MKKRAAVILTLLMVFVLCACASPANAGSAVETEAPKDETVPAADLSGEYDITVWVPETITDLTFRQIDDFNAINADGILFHATVQPMEETAAARRLTADPKTEVDLFCFTQERLDSLTKAGALDSPDEADSEAVIAANDADAVDAASAEGRLYAYPLTADNGFLLYYDKAVIPEEDLSSLGKLLEDCKAAGKRFAMESESNPSYIASWFFGTGCVSEWETDSNGAFLSLKDTFASPQGLIAARGLKELLSSKSFVNSSDVGALNSGCAAVISTVDGYSAAADILGENLGTAELPSFEVDGEEYHLGSFSGFRMLGVRPQEDSRRAAALHRLAQYLSDEQGQLERFYEVSWGPSNLAALANETVGSHPAIAAVMAQKDHAVPRGRIHRAWWTIAGALGAGIKSARDEDGLQQALDNYGEAASSILRLDADALLLIGDWNDWDNRDDAETYYFVDNGDGTASLTIEVPEDRMSGRIVTPGELGTDRGYAQVTEGDEFLRRPGKKDSDNNLVFAAAGSYTLTIDTETGDIVIAANSSEAK